MATVVLKTFKGGNVSPLNDAILWQTAIPGAGIFKGCEVTAARGNILHISQGYGIIKGRFFELYENEVSVQLAETGQTLNGRLYLHMDLSNADEPIKIIAETGETLSSLLMDTNVNYNNSSYDLEMATFKVDAGNILNLTQVFPTVQGGTGGGGGGGSYGVCRDTVYEEGDLVTCGNAPGWCVFVCTQRGATAIAEPIGYTQVQKGGDKVLDGTCLFEARNIIEELDNITLLQDDVDELSDIIAEMRSDTDAVTIKVMTLAAYRALETYSDKTIYYCYKDDVNKEIVAIYLGQNAVYSTGVTVVYHIDEDSSTTKVLALSEDAITKAPTVSLPGYTFVGWREDTTAKSVVLSEKIITSDDTVDLYAVFAEPISVSFNANGGIGEIESVQALALYNNGNEAGASVKLPKRGFTKTDYDMVYWRKGSLNGSPCGKGATVAVTDDTVFYAVWVKQKYEFEYRQETEDFIAPVSGIYRFTAYGASGGNILDGETIKGHGGKGGLSIGYMNLKQNDTVIICVGGRGNDAVTNGAVIGGFNGGGRTQCGTSYQSSSGGGCTHLASMGGLLRAIGKNNISKVYMVAGGGGGATSCTISNQKKYYDGGMGGGTYGGAGKNENGDTSYGQGGNPNTMSGSNPNYVGFGADATGSSSGGYGAGGGGYIGGSAGNSYYGGGGGCGFIGNIPEIIRGTEVYTPMTQGGVNEGNGRVEVELVEAIVG